MAFLNEKEAAVLYNSPMKTIILPGFSIKNKKWAEGIQKKLTLHFPVEIIYWPHWQSGKREENWLEKEADKIVASIGKNKKVNILAKSIGTVVAMIVLKLNPALVNKIILCGVPLRGFREGDERYYEPLKKFPTEKLLSLQNENDHLGGFSEVEKFLHTLNPEIKTISKPRSDHQYPYPEEFIKFLK